MRHTHPQQVKLILNSHLKLHVNAWDSSCSAAELPTNKNAVPFTPVEPASGPDTGCMPVAARAQENTSVAPEFVRWSWVPLQLLFSREI